MSKSNIYRKIALVLCCIYLIIAAFIAWEHFRSFNNRCQVPDEVALERSRLIANNLGAKNLQVDYIEQAYLGSEAWKRLVYTFARDLLWGLALDINPGFHKSKSLGLRDIEHSMQYNYLYICDANTLFLSSFTGKDERNRGDNGAMLTTTDNCGQSYFEFLNVFLPEDAANIDISRIIPIATNSCEVILSYNGRKQIKNSNEAVKMYFYDGKFAHFENLNPMQLK